MCNRKEHSKFHNNHGTLKMWITYINIRIAFTSQKQSNVFSMNDNHLKGTFREYICGISWKTPNYIYFQIPLSLISETIFRRSLRPVYRTRYTIIRKIIRNPQFVIQITCYTKMPLLYELYGESLFSHFASITP